MAISTYDQATSDAIELARLGYKQEFKRAFSPLHVFGLVFSIFGLFSSISSVLVYALPYGGPVAMVWGWGVCSFFLLLVTMSLAELGSAAPTSGGLYYWSFKFASPRWRRLISWIVGYSNTIGLVAGVASTEWGCAVQLMAAVSIGSGQTWSATTGQTYAVFLLLLFLHAATTSLSTSIIAHLQTVYVVLNIVLCLAIIIALPIATPAEFKNSASYAFTGFVNYSGWTDGFAFVLSFLAPLWTISGFDSALHISEETHNARFAVPLGLVGATALAGVMGWAINVVLAFNMGKDIDGLLDSPIGQPMAAILLNSLGQKGMLAIWSIVVAVQYMVGTSCLVASSRQTFAFARDGGLPFSRFLYRVHPRTQTPITCAFAVAFSSALLGLLAFAGDAATSALFELGVVGLYIAYIVPIACRFAGGKAWVPGPFNLGKLGLPVAAVALLWMIFSIIILIFPSSPAPDAPNMNYTVVVLAAWLALCLGYYYMPVYGGVYWFKGPIANVDVDEGKQAESEDLGKEGIRASTSSVDEKSEAVTVF
ncbi:amino acid/polyamine transporter I [Rhodofomes roseus]|uniref:Amino acid/polyamine transporter I n=1 Tax=Rhodofomes roseus TaxID=34475 RepID=A0ABQ8KGA5_9APHY|nr:amino acid/polyamine transporter I [Rhodofomes roseus]KAH9836813.1 amino acid/polyamine transporter I [Rhodofomes roseus]